ncbi:hypothetical protein [Natronoglomus mannanivorans]|uniref:Uncharacterized protein n=1 Tax=Natronoglomus mannanivorans TaxID=2979990 RepID=A0AAP3E3P8_9EURY|nr:hypothetical protein [Halobacteria archaeon AArc-xg1-1]
METTGVIAMPSEPSTDRSLEAVVRTLREELETLCRRTDHLTERVDELETENDSLTDENDRLRSRVRELECETDDLESRTDHLEEQTTELETQTTELESETERLENRTTAAINRSGANKARIEELQARELEKGAHLLETNVDQHDLKTDGGRLERIRKDDDRAYYRLPDADDPLGRGGSVSLAHADLLPIQQLAKMDEDMLRSTTNSLPSRLAAKLWNARTDPTAGDDPWNDGCKNVREYVKASDLKHWIRRQEPGTSETYAKKLVSRTIDAILDLSKNRLAIRRKRERKNGLEYTERRLVLTADADIPGETSSARADDRDERPVTHDVPGQK